MSLTEIRNTLAWLLLGALGFVVPAVFGLLVIYQWVALTWKAPSLREWPTTEGRVVEAHFEERETPDEVIDIEYHAEYEYVVNGRRYTSSALTREPFEHIELRQLSRAGVRLVRGAAVRVYYNPADPGEAVLVAGEPPHWINLAVGIVLLALPCFLTWRLRPWDWVVNGREGD